MLFSIKNLIFILISCLFIATSSANTSDESKLKAYELFSSIQKTQEIIKNHKSAERSNQEFLNYLQKDEAKVAVKTAEQTATKANQAINTTRQDQIFKKGTIVGGISNEVFAEAEEKRREYLGLEPEDQLYFFISQSMPESLIREYALDAALTGGVLVMRGLKENETLDSFFKSQFITDLKPDNKGAIVQLDPRLFDAFKINAVPSIVFTKQSLATLCANSESTNINCKPVDDDSYFKLVGNTTAYFALSQFKEGGADVDRFLDNLKASSNIDAEGIDENSYKTALAEITEESIQASEFSYKNDTHILELEDYQTPFGTFKAPKGTQKLLKRRVH